MFDFILTLSQSEAIFIPLLFGVVIYALSYFLHSTFHKSNISLICQFEESNTIFSNRLFTSIDRYNKSIFDLAGNYYYSSQLYFDSFLKTEEPLFKNLITLDNNFALELNQCKYLHSDLIKLFKEFSDFKTSQLKIAREIFSIYETGLEKFHLNYINPQNIYLRDIAFKNNALQFSFKKEQINKFNLAILNIEDELKLLKNTFNYINVSFKFYDNVDLKEIRILSKYVADQLYDYTSNYFRNIYQYFSDYINKLNTAIAFYINSSNIYSFKVLYSYAIDEFKNINGIDEFTRIDLVEYSKDKSKIFLKKTIRPQNNMFVKETKGEYELLSTQLSKISLGLLNELFEIKTDGDPEYIVLQNPVCSNSMDNSFELLKKGKLK